MRLVLIYVNAYTYGMKNLVSFYAALADGNRLRLLNLIKDGEICVCHLQGVLQTNQPKISRHLAYLRKSGLVDVRRDGKWTHYKLRKLDKDTQKIMAETLSRLASEPQIKKDSQRLKQITCCPSRYGFSSPRNAKIKEG
jgi:ArsR family transcriptional regulator, arsenate/arsenite/antimonite-responsive transcriptional repressor